MNVSITVCRSRAEAEMRKNQVRELAPDANWKTRTIEGAESLSVELLHAIERDPVNVFMAPVSELHGAPQKAVILIMWIES